MPLRTVGLWWVMSVLPLRTVGLGRFRPVLPLRTVGVRRVYACFLPLRTMRCRRVYACFSFSGPWVGEEGGGYPHHTTRVGRRGDTGLYASLLPVCRGYILASLASMKGTPPSCTPSGLPDVNFWPGVLREQALPLRTGRKVSFRTLLTKKGGLKGAIIGVFLANSIRREGRPLRS